jgi:hypothetical protein
MLSERNLKFPQVTDKNNDEGLLSHPAYPTDRKNDVGWGLLERCWV